MIYDLILASGRFSGKKYDKNVGGIGFKAGKKEITDTEYCARKMQGGSAQKVCPIVFIILISFGSEHDESHSQFQLFNTQSLVMSGEGYCNINNFKQPAEMSIVGLRIKPRVHGESGKAPDPVSAASNARHGIQVETMTIDVY